MKYLFYLFAARVTWTSEEFKELQMYFGTHIKEQKNVKEKEGLDAIQKSKKAGGKLQRRSWETIKKKVNYIIMQNKKSQK
jgi:hypothetical protein